MSIISTLSNVQILRRTKLAHLISTTKYLCHAKHISHFIFFFFFFFFLHIRALKRHVQHLQFGLVTSDISISLDIQG